MVAFLYILWLVFVTVFIFFGLLGFYKSIARAQKVKYKYCGIIKEDEFNKAFSPIIEVEIRGQKKNFLVDTGANINVLRFDKFKDIVGDGQVFNLNREATVTGVGTKNETLTCPFIKETIVVEGEEFTTEFLLTPEWEVGAKSIEQRIHCELVGILGAKFISKAKWILDFDNMVIKTEQPDDTDRRG